MCIFQNYDQQDCVGLSVQAPLAVPASQGLSSEFRCITQNWTLTFTYPNLKLSPTQSAEKF